MTDLFLTDKQLEQEVARIARLLWPQQAGGGATMDEGRERDGIYVTEDFVYTIECTVSRSPQKAEEDGEKLVKHVRRLEVQHPTRNVKGWFVTLHDPTPEQRAAILKLRGRVVAVGFEEFRAKLVDAAGYVRARGSYQFGSVRDPESGAPLFDIRYTEQDIISVDGAKHAIANLAGDLNDGRRFVLQGDYGAGKSTTLRQIFLNLASEHRSGRTLRFPLALNLRDHHGQTDPVEAIERHARNVGFSTPSHLVRGWRAGYATLLLDGFDEIASAGWAGRTKRLRDLRHRSMALIREFVRQSPVGTGIIVAGRAHFFDGDNERRQALGTDVTFSDLLLSEFSPQQVETFLRDRGVRQQVPDWIPARPLLLGYLASRGLLSQILSVEAGSDAAAGWDALLDRIAHRESEIEAGIDADTVRRLIEDLATKARSSADGLGPLSSDKIIESFTAVCGYAPDDRGAVLIQRLPGLGGTSAEDGSRVFVDRDLAAAAAAGSIARFVQDPFTTRLDGSTWQSSLPPLGTEVLSLRIARAGFTPAQLSAAALRASHAEQYNVGADIFLCELALRYPYSGDEPLLIKDVLIPLMTLGAGGVDYSRVAIQGCIIERLEIDNDVSNAAMPMFTKCTVVALDGRAGRSDLPPDHFIACEFEDVEDAAKTTQALLSLSLPLGVKVLLTVLKKLYAQSGRGRKDNAFYRGLDHRAQSFVPDVLALLKREGFVLESTVARQKVWLPTQGSEMRRRAMKMLSTPSSSDDPVLKQFRDA